MTYLDKVYKLEKCVDDLRAIAQADEKANKDKPLLDAHFAHAHLEQSVLPNLEKAQKEIIALMEHYSDEAQFTLGR